MDTEHLFARDDVAPSWWANLVNRILGVYADGVVVFMQDSTHIEVPASAGVGAAVCSIQGRWRYIEATVTRAHPGGAAATYDIYVTAADTSIVSSPAPYTDNTNYGFALAIVAHGATPAVVPGTVDVFRKIGELQWDGAAITRIDQLVPAVGLHAHRHALGQPDAITPSDLGAAAVADLATEVARAEAAEATEVARAEGAEAALSAAIAAETSRAEATEPPIGAIMPYTGSGDPVAGRWVVADGRLIDKTTFAAFFARTGHAYNLGIDPGSNKVRIPDKRGKKSIGAIDMGTGAGPNDNSHAQLARGARSGEVNHVTTTSEMPSHGHAVTDPQHTHEANNSTGEGANYGNAVVPGNNGVFAGVDMTMAYASTGIGIQATGGGAAHNNLDPSEADSMIVRIA